MKGQTESYSFLIGIIITLLILVPIFLWFWNSIVADSDTKECFDSLSKAIPEMKDAERGNVVCNLGDKQAIVAFPPGGKIYHDVDYILDYTSVLEQCRINSCICLCSYKSGESPSKCGDDSDEKCININWAKNIVGGVVAVDSISDFIPANFFFIKSNIQALPIYYERNGNELGICFSSPCIIDTEIKEGEICKKECNSVERNKTKLSCELVSCKKNCKWTTENKCVDMCMEKCDSVLRLESKENCEAGECDFNCHWNNEKCEDKLYLDLTKRKLPN